MVMPWRDSSRRKAKMKRKYCGVLTRGEVVTEAMFMYTREQGMTVCLLGRKEEGVFVPTRLKWTPARSYTI
jgi:hypothetical protein